LAFLFSAGPEGWALGRQHIGVCFVAEALEAKLLF
jgi:hypothetical protein